MSGFSHQSTGDDCRGFSKRDLAFAFAWEIYAPGLSGWNISVDPEEAAADLILVDPPLVYGDGFTVRKSESGVEIKWSGGRESAATLRDALLLICPLAPEALAAADGLAALPEPLM